MKTKLDTWCKIKNTVFHGQAGLQLSINSTNEEQRKQMFKGKALSLKEISEIAKELPKPIGRKYCLNFALADGYETDGEKLKELFNPKYWMVKITPIHNNNACNENGVKTSEGYNSFTPYKSAEESFKQAGFDVLVFIPSMDEEQGCITCGNALLGGSQIKLKEDNTKYYECQDCCNTFSEKQIINTNIDNDIICPHCGCCDVLNIYV